MSQIVRLPRRLRRDFRLPGQKPDANVRIRWKNKISRGLLHAWITTPWGAVDLVNPKDSAWLVGTSIAYGGGNAGGGMISTTDGSDNSKLQYRAHADAENLGTAYTSLTHADRYTSGSIDILGPSGGAYNKGGYCLGLWDDGKVYSTADASFRSVTSDMATTTGDHIWGVARDGGVLDFILDGVYINSTITATKELNAARYLDVLTQGNTGLEATATERFNGIVYATFVWGRKLSEPEIDSMAADFYQLLEPINATVYFIPAVGGGAAHSLTLSESIGASAENSILWAIAANAPESIAATSAQSTSAAFAVSASESAAASSAQSSSGATAVTVSESSALTSGQSSRLQIVASASESAAISDTESVAIVSGLVAVTVSESISATSAQAVNQAAAVSISESANTGSDQSASAAFATAVAEAVAAADLQSISFALESSISEAMTAGSAQASLISIDGALSEAIAATSAQSAVAAFAPSVAFSTAVAESVITAAAYQTSYADSIQAVSVESIGIAGETVSFTITVQRKAVLATHVATATLN